MTDTEEDDMHPTTDPRAVRKPKIRSAVVDALVYTGIDAVVVSDLRNSSVYIVTTVDDLTTGALVTPEVLITLVRSRELFDTLTTRAAEAGNDNLIVALRNFSMEVQAVTKILQPYADASSHLVGHDKEVVEAKLFVLRYLLGSIDEHLRAETA